MRRGLLFCVNMASVLIPAHSFSALRTYEDPREILRRNWSPFALGHMFALVKETRTHHRHYFRSQDLYSLYADRKITRWVARELSQKKKYPPKPKVLSYFLVRPEEIPLFLRHIDGLIRMKFFEVIECDMKKNYFVIELWFPFKKRVLGLSVTKDPITHVLRARHAPYLKLIFRSNTTLATLYPVAQKGLRAGEGAFPLPMGPLFMGEKRTLDLVREYGTPHNVSAR